MLQIRARFSYFWGSSAISAFGYQLSQHRHTLCSLPMMSITSFIISAAIANLLSSFVHNLYPTGKDRYRITPLSKTGMDSE